MFYIGHSNKYSPFQREPTVVGVPNFNAAEDAAALRGAMKGFGTDEQAIIDILTARSNAQRQAIAQAFTHEYGRVSMILTSTSTNQLLAEIPSPA